MDRILRVNMSTLETKFEKAPARYNNLGGRSLTSTIVADEVPATAHPLSPNNKLVIAPGIVSGTSAPSSGRLSVGAKSPLTGGIKESNAGGLAAQKLARLGIKAIVVEGEPKDKKLHLLSIDKDGATLSPAGKLAGKGMYEVDKALWEQKGKVAIMGIGPAGEMKMAMAGVSINDPENGPGRYAGRGGMGAVMGAKGLKAITVDDTGSSPVKAPDDAKFREAAKKLTEALRTHAVTSETLPTYGTAALINVMNEAGGLPTRNFSSGRFEGASKISGERINELVKERKGEGKVGHPCHPGCVIRCSNIYPDKNGKAVTACVEYESDWALGANCGIDDLDAVAELIRICNDVGIDTIEAGVAIGVAMEGGAIKFGDAKGAIDLLNQVGKGTPMGRIIGGGAALVGEALGVRRVPVVKRQGLPAYEPRAVKGIGVTYATSTMGADHTSGYTIAPEILGVGGQLDPLSVDEAKAELSRNFQAVTAFVDSTGYCIFVTFATLDIPAGYEGLIGTVNAILGTDWKAEDVLEYGKKVLKTEREFNKRAGFNNADDRLPEFMYNEKLPPHNTVYDVPDSMLDKVHNY
jgi:aldehyde:ferredoxin oxidoreductase